ncbi:oocyte zinc finger protein XlCOF6-like [Anopheles maculipalpis]|uniref:oocyte zinc finger protein XlCOF6-like n=1 Tax=Anopheles maculipalpis TaxID=1496333 RepID=UPI00215914ED|nr:oocyte zinc finger protein XlCOF6-like [Anopheles maculipalpis]
MDILIEPDCYKVCRICMESCEEDCVCVYDEFEDVLLSEVIKECARVEIRKNDALPRNACRNCAEYLIIAYHIIQKCRDSDVTLRSIFKHELNLHREEKKADATASSVDMDPSGYEFLLANGYDDIMLDDERMLLENANASCDFVTPSGDKKTADDDNDDEEVFADETAIQQQLLPAVPATQNQPDYQEREEESEDPEALNVEQIKQVLSNEDVALILEYGEKALALSMVKNTDTQHESSETNEEDISFTDPEWQKKCCGCRKLFDSEQSLREHSQTVHRPIAWSPAPRSASDVENPLRCMVCFKSFSSKQLLKEHQRTVNRKYACPQCGKRFMTQTNLDIHSKCHKNRETYKCCGCRIDFEQELDLLVHSQEVHRPERTTDAQKPFECDTCYRRYPTRKSLATHKRQIRQFQCQLCGAIFMKQLFLKLHLERTHQQEAVETRRRCCGGCKEDFDSAAALREHSERVHKPTTNTDGSAGSGTDDGKPFECKVCRKRFSSMFFLLQHQQKVWRQKCYPCTICGRTFGRAHDLSNHETTHSNEMPFECSVCGRRFKNKLYLRNHQKLHTSNAKDQVCVECGKGFRTKDLLKTHLISHSQERKYACTACPATFKRLQCLKIHTRVHTREKAFVCTVCQKRYVQSSDLKRHMRTHNPGDEGKPFQCEYCLRRYPRKDYLKVHIRKQHLEKLSETETVGLLLLQDVGLASGESVVKFEQNVSPNEIDDFINC